MHLIPVIIFLAIAVLFLPCWLICCICSCAGCCCCNCCKTNKCKCPFYVVSLVIYAFVFCISIYGLSQSNSIFVGLADTECSTLRFIGEVLDGETKETKPKWAGITGITDLLENAKTQIGRLSSETASNLETKKGNVTNKKDEFEMALQTQSGNINSVEDDQADHKITLSGLSDSTKNGDYKLDIIYQFGTFVKNNPTAGGDDTVAKKWYMEYKRTADNANNYMNQAESNYNSLQQNTNAASSLTEGINSIKNIGNSFNDVKDQISGVILDYSDEIDEYGKLGFKIVFSILMVIDAAIAAFVSLMFFCQLPVCQNCCFKCLLKSAIHILWNVMAFVTFLTLLLGFIFSLLGVLGKDLIKVFTFLVSDENLNKEHPILLESASKYLKKCVNGDGNIASELNLNLNALNNMDALTTASAQIAEAITQANDLLSGKVVYNNYRQEFQKRKDKSIDFKIIKTDHSSELFYYTYKDSTGTIHNAFESILSQEKSTVSDSFISLEESLTELDTKYTNFLTAEVDSLRAFQTAISSLANIFQGVVGDNGIYGILNCKFIGRNVRVMLKNLDMFSPIAIEFYYINSLKLLNKMFLAFYLLFFLQMKALLLEL